MAAIALADVYAALAYYYDHREEIQESIEKEAALVEEIRKQSPSSLKQKTWHLNA